MTLGEKIKKYRKLKKLTQEELAEKSGISTITLYRWENGIRSPSVEALQKIAQTLEVPVSTFLDESYSETLQEPHNLYNCVKSVSLLSLFKKIARIVEISMKEIIREIENFGEGEEK